MSIRARTGAASRGLLGKAMKDIVVVEIDGPLEEVAALYADPANNTKWMTSGVMNR